MIDNLVHIAHNVKIGEDTAIAACVAIAGSTIIGKRCTLAGVVGVADHVTIADDVHLTGMSMVTGSITEPGVYSSGTGLMAVRSGAAVRCVSGSWMTLQKDWRPLRKRLQIEPLITRSSARTKSVDELSLNCNNRCV
ncbi:MAG: hypothetical protein CM1200mP20_03020 [Pseudomonadota bacterium]|nr:MAG: hypothetical protein CM1200mP20_03020 [Pseudomonadota bacterium]